MANKGLPYPHFPAVELWQIIERVRTNKISRYQAEEIVKRLEVAHSYERDTLLKLFQSCVGNYLGNVRRVVIHYFEPALLADEPSCFFLRHNMEFIPSRMVELGCFLSNGEGYLIVPSLITPEQRESLMCTTRIALATINLRDPEMLVAGRGLDPWDTFVIRMPE